MALANKVVIGSVGRDVPSTWMLKVPQTLAPAPAPAAAPTPPWPWYRARKGVPCVCMLNWWSNNVPSNCYRLFDFARFCLANRLLATMKVIRQRPVPYLLPHTLLHHALLLAIASRCRSYLLFALPVNERLPQLSVHS